MAAVKQFITGGLRFSVELEEPWKFMGYTAPVAERIRKAASGEAIGILPTRAGDDIPERTFVKSRSELPADFDAHTLDFSQYEPFAADDDSVAEELFSLKILGGVPEWAENIDNAELLMDLSGISPGYRVFRLDGNTIYEFLDERGVRSGFLSVPGDCRICEFATIGRARPYTVMSMIDFATRIVCTYVASGHDALMVHSSVVRRAGKANMFLGASGTGKSTHSRLWLNNIPGTDLINDDNPIIRLEDGHLFVYGTPWSGKTPCYRNVRVPVGSIVKLKQGSTNHIRRVTGLEAYTNIIGSVSSIRWSRRIMDEITSLMSRTAMTVPCFVMECLPDDDAAETCCAATDPLTFGE